MSTTLFVFGGKSTALEIHEAATRQLNRSLLGVVLVVMDDESPDGRSRITRAELPDRLAELDSASGYILSMWNQEVRRQSQELAQSLGMIPFTVIHPSAQISPTATIGNGVYVAANSVVSTSARIYDHVVVNFSVTVGHDSQIGAHTFLNPGARISGNVSIGQRALIGANAVVFQGRRVGDDSLVDALTYVDRDIEPNMICSSKELRILRRVV
jgi:sugar O-acyltransferase (sialic acid O-acetyltransferase NeuD family)